MYDFELIGSLSPVFRGEGAKAGDCDAEQARLLWIGDPRSGYNIQTNLASRGDSLHSPAAGDRGSDLQQGHRADSVSKLRELSPPRRSGAVPVAHLCRCKEAF